MQVEPKLREHKVVPLWTLPDKYGEPFNFAKKRGRAHFLLLVCAPSANPRPFLEGLAPELVRLRSLPAQGIVVVGSADAAGPLPTPPLVVAVDAEGRVRERYLPEEAVAGLFVLDRFGALYHQWIVREVADLPSIKDVTEWIEAVGMQCGV